MATNPKRRATSSRTKNDNKAKTRASQQSKGRKGTKVRGGARPPAKKNNAMLYAGICGGAFFFLLMCLVLSGGDEPKSKVKAPTKQADQKKKKTKRKIPIATQKAAYKDNYNQEDAIDKAIEKEFGDPPSDIDESRTWGRKKQAEKTKRLNKMLYDLQTKHKVNHNELSEIYSRGLRENWSTK